MLYLYLLTQNPKKGQAKGINEFD